MQLVCQSLHRTLLSYKASKETPWSETIPNQLCGKAFTSNTDLTFHLRRHTGEKSYQCNICDKTFTSSFELAIPLRLQTGEELYSGNLYNKDFPSNTYLAIHPRRHNGEKLYKSEFL